ncbi:MAG: ABC transporter substrate-binding protein [Actinomycetota bacterium]
MSLRPYLVVAMVLALFASACADDGSDDQAVDASATAPPAATDPGTSTTDVPADDEPDGDDPDPGATEESPADPVFPRTVVDALGNEFTLDEPAKIACAWTGCDELHASLGSVIAAGSLLPGYEDSPMFYPVGPPAFIPSNAFDLEAWAAADVDFALSRVPVTPLLTTVADVVNVFYLHHPSYGESTTNGYQAYLDNLRLVGQLLGREAAADTVIADLEEMLVTLRELSTPELAGRSIAILFPGAGYQVIGDENPFCDVVSFTGLGTCLDHPTSELSAEAFLAEDPDWIIYQGGAQGTTAGRDDPTWTRLTAVAEGRVLDSAFGQYYCCGTRTLRYALQEFVAVTIPDSGIADPGDPTTYDPDTSPLLP